MDFIANLDLLAKLVLAAITVALCFFAAMCAATPFLEPRGYEPPHPSFAKCEALVAGQNAKEDAHIAEIEARLVERNDQLNVMRMAWPEKVAAGERVDLRMKIFEDERMLAFLRLRKTAHDPSDRRQKPAGGH